MNRDAPVNTDGMYHKKDVNGKLLMNSQGELINMQHWVSVKGFGYTSPTIMSVRIFNTINHRNQYIDFYKIAPSPRNRIGSEFKP